MGIGACAVGSSKRPRGSAVIIGSGFGGSVAALRLAEAGIQCTLLERGKRWPITEDESTFPSLRAPDQRAAWLSTTTTLPGAPVATFEPYTGLLERVKFNGIDVIRGAAVGGNSPIMGGISIQPNRSLFESFLPEVPYTEMDEVWYPRVREMLSLARIPDDVLASPTYVSTRIYMDQAEKAGLDVTIIENAVNWDLVRAEIDGRKHPSAIWGDYNYGLNSGAKNSLDRSYLPKAEATGLVDVRPLHRVTRIRQDDAGDYEVHAERIDTSGNVLETVVVTGRYLFLGAGSLGSTELLLKARAQGDLPKLSSAVGERWSNNGQNIFVRSQLGIDTGPLQGGPPVAFIRHYDNPIAPVSIELGPAPFGFEAQSLINIGHAAPGGYGVLEWDQAEGKLKLDWDSAYDKTPTDAALATLDILNRVNGGVTGRLPGVTDPLTYHPLGGAVIGRACDSFGRVDGYDRLYVVDGALIPGVVPTANPSFTIAAIAERCLDEILASDIA